MDAPLPPTELLRQGILACRREHWHTGLDLLTRAAQHLEHEGNLPSLFYSYLGVAMARCEGRRKEGLELCRWAVEREPAEAECYVNFARVALLLGRRRVAYRAVEQGLALAPDDARLAAVAFEIGVRRRPVLPLLRRDHPVNVLLGRGRHHLRQHWLRFTDWRTERRRERLEDDLLEATSG